MENPKKRPNIRTTKNLIVVFSVVITTDNEFLGSRALELIRREQGTSTMFNMADFGRGGAVLC